jgi:hypothetical protein
VEVPLILCVVVVTQDFVELVGALTVAFVPALTYVYDWSKASNPRQATHNFHPMPKHRNNMLVAVITIRVIALSYRGAIRAFLPLFRFRLVSLFLSSAHECCDSNKKKNNNNNKQGK